MDVCKFQMHLQIVLDNSVADSWASSATELAQKIAQLAELARASSGFYIYDLFIQGKACIIAIEKITKLYVEEL